MKVTQDVFKSICKNVCINRISQNYQKMEEYQSSHLENWNAMFLKLYLVNSHLDFFTDNMGAVCDEYEERFHKNVAEMEKR